MLPIQHLPIETPPVEPGIPAPDVTVQMLNSANAILESVKQTTYQHITEIVPDQGILNCDCSGFVSFIVEQVAPRHYAMIPKEADEDRPRAFMYHDFFAGLMGSANGWTRISRVADMQPGDILAWRFSEIQTGHDTGHVMIIRSVSTGPQAGQYNVQVDDSAAMAHFHDTRGNGLGQFPTGVGSGTITLQTDATDAPAGFLFAPGDHFVTLPIVAGRAGKIA